MPVTYFPCLANADTIEVEFHNPTGGTVAYRLLVDSGFTGASSFVLPHRASFLAHAQAASSATAGALSGSQARIVVVCSIPALSFQTSAVAILADTTGLVLPPGVDGMAGLPFLRHYRRWGAEQGATGDWQFFLETAMP